MKIFYKQPEKDEQSSLRRFDIQNCYFKKLSIDRDHGNITKKTHHHKGFEMHIVTEGYQEYAIAGKIYKLQSGCFLLIYPKVPHTVTAWSPNTKKYSITFDKRLTKKHSCFLGNTTDRIISNLSFISTEVLLKKEFSATLIENNILEILVWAFRLSGIEENKSTQKQDDNLIISLAKQFIDDNIETTMRVEDVSKYCYLSTKQMTRIFRKFEGISPKEYITKERIARIEKLLADHTLSLQQISETMHFSNEYYFNTFFKKHSGMPPGEYRKMLGQ